MLSTHGIPQALYTDRASWAVYTPRTGQGPDRTQPTQVGRALARLGIEHILAFSPQARGRGERVHRTLQDRLVQELRLAGVRSSARANAFITGTFLPRYNLEFAHPAADPASAFVTAGGAELHQILCIEEARTIGRDNTIVLDNVRLQIPKQPGRPTCAGLAVLVRRHLDGSHSVWWGRRCLGYFDLRGRTQKEAPGTAA